MGPTELPVHVVKASDDEGDTFWLWCNQFESRYWNEVESGDLRTGQVVAATCEPCLEAIERFGDDATSRLVDLSRGEIEEALKAAEHPDAFACRDCGWTATLISCLCGGNVK